jgi:hypothetical protein
MILTIEGDPNEIRWLQDELETRGYLGYRFKSCTIEDADEPTDVYAVTQAMRGVTITGDTNGAVAELLKAFDAMSYELGAIDQAWVDARARFTLTEDGDAGEGGGG